MVARIVPENERSNQISRAGFRNVVIRMLRISTCRGSSGLNRRSFASLHGRDDCTAAGMLSRRNQLFSTVICILGICSSAGSGAESTGPAITVGVPAKVVELTNAERSRRGRARLRTNPRLMRAAQVHAEQMARAGEPAHVRPDATYPRAADRLAAVGYRWQSYGENLALGQPTPAAAVRSWMRSRGHRRNLVSPTFTELGVGYAIDRSGRPYYVQVFANPST